LHNNATTALLQDSAYMLSISTDYGTVSPVFLMTASSLSGIEPMILCIVVKEIDLKISEDDVRVPLVAADCG